MSELVTQTPYSYKDIEAMEKGILAGASEEDITGYLVDKRGLAPGDAKTVFSVATKNRAAREQYGAEVVDSYLQTKYPDVVTVATEDQLRSAEVDTSPEPVDAQEVFDDVATLVPKVSTVESFWNAFDPSEEYLAKERKRKQSIKTLMAEQGLNVDFDARSQEWYNVDTNEEIDSGFFHDIRTNAGSYVGDAAGAWAGTKAGALAGTAVAGPIGSVVGGAIGAIGGAVVGGSVGSGLDYLESAFSLDEDLDADVIMNNAFIMGMDGGAFGILGSTATLGVKAGLRGTKATAKAIARAKDNVVGGKVREALVDLGGVPNSTPSETYEALLRVNEGVNLGRTATMRELATKAMTDEEALPLVDKAVREVKSAGEGLRATLTNRAKAVNALVDSGDSALNLRNALVDLSIDSDKSYNKLYTIAKSRDFAPSGVRLKLPEVADETINKAAAQVSNKPSITTLVDLQGQVDRALLANPTDELKALSSSIEANTKELSRKLGGSWYKEYTKARADRQKALEFTQLAMFKAFKDPNMSSKEVAAELVKYANTGDAKVVIDKLSGPVREEAEAAITDALVKKYTNNLGTTGKYTDFAALSDALAKYDFKSEGVQLAVNEIKAIADVFKIDPHLAKVAGARGVANTPSDTLKSAAFDLVSKYGIAGTLGSAVSGGNLGAVAALGALTGGRAAYRYVKARGASNSLARVLSEPLKPSVFKEFIEQNAGSEGAVRAYQQAYANSRVFDSVPMYVNKKGKYSLTPSKGYSKTDVARSSIATSSILDRVLKEEGLTMSQSKAWSKALKERGYKAIQFNGSLTNI